MTTTTDLLKRLEAGETGRELEVAIENLLGIAQFEQKHAGADFDMVRVRVGAYTTSLDAAVALVERVLPGCEMCLSQRKPRPDETCAVWWNVTLFRLTKPGGYVTVKTPSAPAGLIAALLKARGAGDE